MPRTSAHSPEKIARIVAAVKAGLDLRAAGLQAGVSHMQVKRWVEAAAKAPAPPLVPAPPDPAPAEIDALPDDPVEMLRMFIREARVAIANAKHTGNNALLSSLIGNTTKLAQILSREEKRAGESADHVRFSKADIDRANASVDAKLAAYLDRPLLCDSCGEALSVAWGHGQAATVAGRPTPRS